MLPLFLMLRTADACVCADSPPTRHIAVSDTFPVGGHISVFLSGWWPAARRTQEAAAYRLRGPDGFIALSGYVDGTRLQLQPARPLEPETTYTVERAAHYLGDRLLSDAQVVRSDRGDPLERRWTPVETLRTGAGGERGPVSVALTTPGYWIDPGETSCGAGESVNAGISVSGTLAPTDTLSIEVEGQGTLWSGPANSRGVHFSDMFCDPMPVHTDILGPLRLRIRATDAEGVVIAASAWVQATAPQGPARMKPRTAASHKKLLGANAAHEESYRHLRRAPIRDAPPHLAPSSCPRLSEDIQQVVSGVSWPQYQQAVLEPSPGRRVLLSEAEDGTLALHDMTGARLGERSLAWGTQTEAGEGMILAREPTEAGVVLVALSPDGQQQWSKRLDGFSNAPHSLFSAIGGGHVLVGHRWWSNEYMDGEDVWLLLDLQTGETRAVGSLAALHAERQPISTVAWDGERFWLGGQRSLFPLGPDGAPGEPVLLPEVLGDVQRIWPAQSGLEIVSSSALDLLYARVDRVGQLTFGPVRLNPGAPRGRVASLVRWGDRVAVAWNDEQPWVTLIDGDRAAYPIAPGGGPAATGIHLAVENGALRALVGQHHDGGWQPVWVSLSCP